MQNIDKPEVCPEKLVNGILRGMRRRGLPATVDLDDLRQEGMVALAIASDEKRNNPRMACKIAKDAMVDHLRLRFREAKYFTGLQTVEGCTVDSSGSPTGSRSRRTSDPFFVLDVDGLEAAQRAWERERAERWA